MTWRDFDLAHRAHYPHKSGHKTVACLMAVACRLCLQQPKGLFTLLRLACVYMQRSKDLFTSLRLACVYSGLKTRSRRLDWPMPTDLFTSLRLSCAYSGLRLVHITETGLCLQRHKDCLQRPKSLFRSLRLACVYSGLNACSHH